MDEDEELVGVEVEPDPEAETGEEPETQGEGEDQSVVNDNGDDEEDAITFGGQEVRGEDEPEHIRDLRRGYREQQKRIRELEAQTAPREEEIGPRPALADYDYDEDQHAEAVEAWTERKNAARNRQQREQEERDALQREWESEVAELDRQRASLKVRDYDAAHDRVAAKLNDAQQALLTQAARNKAALWFALGQDGAKLDELAAIKNPVKFVAAAARLDMEIKVEKRKPTTSPEGVHRGSAPIGANKSGAALAKLEAEAERTGDRSKVIAFKRQMKARAA